MTERVTVSADKSRLLPPHSPQKGYRITRAEAKELGLLDSAEKPVQQRRTQATEAPAEAPKPQKRRTTRKRK